MNKDRRKKLEAIMSTIEQVKADLEEIKGEEQEAYDNLIPGAQEGEAGEKSQAAITAMDDADSSLQEVMDYIETAKE